ncbi:putative Sarcosine oxidase, alpha subunit family protein [Desulfamplus magnetovallimortis]|uniref:Putative Sarcosine oxidase, alpha subunit family protein n=1 Tax=Desulfamplus magnetovallimortis TaxID=1246637 RepID=A0A1W1HGE3_9BACT|nr:2Fe-2S iron-sulfur cluster-binding protein [Desulfamplus magnetovallimortis]SLM31458.1 putative Sarcosine oxidase, alpha subunit family protein [Desulfamplus magnetovallimortis]
MMTRFNQLPTLRIDPTKKVIFNYKGKSCAGSEGDTVATALYANGVRVFARSLKYHRPRGLYSLDGECSNTCMEVDGIPNVRTENTLAKQGMEVKEQNVKGSAENDMMAFIDKLDWMMPAGFYYRTMHKPASMWPVAMKQIRKAAGLGVMSPDHVTPGKFDEIFPRTDVVVIGGGPAGMQAALAAADKGVRVIIMESRPWLGGFFDYRAAEYSKGKPLYSRARELAEKVEAHPGIRVLKHTSMVGAYSNNLVTGFQIGGEGDSFTERYVEIRANAVVVAVGCIERPLIFDNNERPGVMQVACAHRLARTYGILAGEKALFSVGHDLGLEAAIDLYDLGMKIACVADIREDGQNPELLLELAKRNIPVLKGWVVTKAHGSKQVKKATIATIDGTITRDFNCNVIVASAGFTPITGPLTLAGAKLRYDSHTNFFIPETLPEKTHIAGRMTGLEDSMAIEASGTLAGIKAAMDSLACTCCGSESASEGDSEGDSKEKSSSSSCCEACDDAALKAAEEALKALPGPSRGTKLVTAPVKGRKSFICFDEDTTIKNIKQAIEMGFDVPELIKRFTSAGTGPGQGGIPGHNLPLFVAKYEALSGVPAPVRPTTVRPPLVPTLIATYAGTNHIMMKRTPMDEMQRSDGGIFRKIGVWERARYFSDDFECKAEIENVRNNVGMLDGSTLGKFRIHGPDALKALQRVYTSDMSKIKPGRVKYSAMCNDDGCVIDDGVVIKIAENDYYFTTSTGRAGQTVEWVRYHTRYDGWDFNMVNLTDSMGVINLSGPNARKVLQKITDEDVSNEAFPFSAYKEFMVKDTIPVKAMRLGFVGELSYEFHVPSSYMVSLWNMLKEAGKEFGIKNFGVEAQNVLRMEKCHIILGQESEQRTNLLDLGLGFLWDRKKTDAKTVGAVALAQAEKDQTRFRLVGFKMENNGRAPKDGSLIVDDKVRGYICTARDSFSLNEAVGMALVESHMAKIGTRLEIFEDECGDQRIYGKVVPMPFYDPDGSRMKS